VDVVSVMDVPAHTKAPYMPPEMRGVIPFHDQGIPLIDLRILFGDHSRLEEMETLVETMELRKQVSDSLARLQSDRALVPIDRDPVPERYAELVRRYFETLGDPNQ